MITDEATKRDYYRALLERRRDYVGIFYVGVRTTGIFCIATCRARKPKYENVAFYASAEEAIHRGFRACKVCKPTMIAATPPAQVTEALGLVRRMSDERVTDAMLRAHGLNPVFLRRWFRHTHGLTFQAYQRSLRVGTVQARLVAGTTTVTQSAYQAGYESLSGFGKAFKQLTGSSPSQTKVPMLVKATYATPLGPMEACASAQGLCLLAFSDLSRLPQDYAALEAHFGIPTAVGTNRHLELLGHELARYFAGTLTAFTVPLELPGTPFQQSVWHALVDISFGSTRAYAQVARKVGTPGGSQAVGRANGQNRVAIVVPCHRVIGSTGKLTGYAGGMERKKWLLQHEGAVPGTLF